MVNKTSPFVKRSELLEGEFGMVRVEVLRRRLFYTSKLVTYTQIMQ
jgi:hypothetical protein